MFNIRARDFKSKQLRKTVLMDSAQQLYETQLIPQLPNVEAIAKNAGLAKGSFYNYFSSKEEIFLEILKREYKDWFYQFDATKVQKENFSRYFTPLVENTIFMTFTSKMHIQNSENISIEKRNEFNHFLHSHISILTEKISRDLNWQKQLTKQKIQQSLSLIVGRHLYQTKEEFDASFKDCLNLIWSN